MCQYFVQLQLEVICQQVPQSVIYDMDDILMGGFDKDVLENMLNVTKRIL